MQEKTEFIPELFFLIEGTTSISYEATKASSFVMELIRSNAELMEKKGLKLTNAGLAVDSIAALSSVLDHLNRLAKEVHEQTLENEINLMNQVHTSLSSLG